ncbi:MAG TPA: GNAT family N-acetyltransferase [Gaiellaceae bacterium]|nr:GNAT family N-acetyltransferase [Gaiellaceae bacterium]
MIETERLFLRPIEWGDLDTVARWNADERFTRHLAGPLTREQTEEAFERWRRHWDEHGFGRLGIVDRASGELVGRTGPQYHRAWPHDPEVGWAVDPAWWGRGIATEAGRATVGWTLGELGFARVVSITTEVNLASRRVMEKLGFELHEVVPYPELGVDLWVHALDSKPLYA